MNLYDQLRARQVLPQAFEDWKAYREALTTFIIQNTPKHSTLALWGAGRCNDIDLNRLQKHFKKIILKDCSHSALQAALCQYHLIEDESLELEISDFIGLCDDLYRTYADTLLAPIRQYGRSLSITHLVQTANRALEPIRQQILQKSILPQKPLYDVSVAIGLHSQLLSMLDWIWQIILETLGFQEQSFRQELIALNTPCIQKLNDLLYDSTQKTLLIGCELQRYGRPGQIQGALQALHDFERRTASHYLNEIHSMHLIWPFSPKNQMAYEMCIKLFKK